MEQRPQKRTGPYHALTRDIATPGSGPLQSRHGEPAVEPEEVGILVKRTASNQFEPLEVLNVLPQSDTAFLANTLEYYTISGPHSTTRFRAGEPIEFYIKSFLDRDDPRAALFPVTDPTLFALFVTRPEGQDRRVVLDDDGSTSHAPNAGMPLLARLFGKASFMLSPTRPLAPGEYAIQYPLPGYAPTPGSVHGPGHGESHASRLFCFGVDP